MKENILQLKNKGEMIMETKKLENIVEEIYKSEIDENTLKYVFSQFKYQMDKDLPIEDIVKWAINYGYKEGLKDSINILI